MRSRFAVHSLSLAAACLWMAALAASARGGSFFGLGDLPGGTFDSHAYCVSADGSVVVGTSVSSWANGSEAFRWTSGGGMVGLGDLPGRVGFYILAMGVSADGSVIVGSSQSASGSEAFIWTSGGGMVGLGDLQGRPFYSVATAVSADGSIIVGGGYSTSGREAFRWTSGEGMIGLGDLPGGSFLSWASRVSADGSVVVGSGQSASGNQAFIWTSGGGMVGLGDLPGGIFDSNATSVSADGSVIVGHGSSASGIEAFRWTSGEGMIGLGDLPGGAGSYATDVSADGSVIVGNSYSYSPPPVNYLPDVFIWDAQHGMRNLQNALSELLSPADRAVLDDWTLSHANAVSADGRTIVGWGTNPSGNQEAWLAHLGTEVPEPASRILLGLGLTMALAARSARRFAGANPRERTLATNTQSISRDRHPW